MVISIVPRIQGIEFHKQFRNLQVMTDHITSQEKFLQILDQEESIPDMAKKLAREAITADLASNKRVFLDFFYNIIASLAEKNQVMDVEFVFVMMGNTFFEVDRSVLWYDDQYLPIPFEIGKKFGEAIIGGQIPDAQKKIISFYKDAEARFDRELGGINLDRCSLLVMEEHYPQSAFHITLRLPAQILNNYPVSI